MTIFLYAPCARTKLLSSSSARMGLFIGFFEFPLRLRTLSESRSFPLHEPSEPQSLVRYHTEPLFRLRFWEFLAPAKKARGLKFEIRPLSMMASDTSSFSRSGTPMPKPKFIGDRWMETPPKQRSYPGKASRPFKRPESSGLRLSANQIGKSNTDTFCLG